MPKQSQPTAPSPPSAEAREALAKWGLALRYAAAAVTPAATRAATRVKERFAKSNSGEGSLKERLNPSVTEKGGKIGDAADAVLEKMGTPGKLAAKTSLGSRIVDRLTPDVGDSEVDDARAESAPAEDQAEEVVEPDEPDGSGDEPAEPSAESEEQDTSEEEGDQPGRPDPGHDGAAPLHTDFEHAYSDEVENYEHQDAYASTR